MRDEFLEEVPDWELIVLMRQLDAEIALIKKYQPEDRYKQAVIDGLITERQTYRYELDQR